MRDATPKLHNQVVMDQASACAACPTHQCECKPPKFAASANVSASGSQQILTVNAKHLRVSVLFPLLASWAPGWQLPRRGVRSVYLRLWTHEALYKFALRQPDRKVSDALHECSRLFSWLASSFNHECTLPQTGMDDQECRC